MRILFCSTPGQGHVRPMLPLLKALHRRGHVVAWAGAAETQPVVLAAAAVERCFDVGPGRPQARQALEAIWPERAATQGPLSADLLFPRLFGAVLAPAMLDGLADAMRAFAPDLVIGETAALAVPLAAQLTGCLHVTHGFGIPLPPQRLKDAAALFAATWRTATGGPPPHDAGLYRHLYLDVFPRSLLPAASLQAMPRLALQPLDCASPGRPPMAAMAALATLPGAMRMPEAPLVYLSLGTVLQRPELLRTALSALSGLPVRLLVSTGPEGDPALLGPLPPNVHAERFIAQNELLPHCRLVVSHGGSGTLLAACAHGIPQLVLPQMADQFANANALQRSGAGLALTIGAGQTAYAIREAAEQLLVQPGFAGIAAGLSREIARMPGADTVARLLESLVRGEALGGVPPEHLNLPVRSRRPPSTSS
jgi:UDP:flavonoid glycosyltransferase YjiC (YdhE family)